MNMIALKWTGNTLNMPTISLQMFQKQMDILEFKLQIHEFSTIGVNFQANIDIFKLQVP